MDNDKILSVDIAKKNDGGEVFINMFELHNCNNHTEEHQITPETQTQLSKFIKALSEFMNRRDTQNKCTSTNSVDSDTIAFAAPRNRAERRKTRK